MAAARSDAPDPVRNSAAAGGDTRAARPASGRRRLRWLFCLGFALATVILMLWFLETEMVYPGARRMDGDWAPADLVYEDAFFESADGTRLHGWYLPHPESQAVVLYCHGNGEIVADARWTLADLRDELRADFFIFDYRGYGRSEGRPDEAGVVADGEAALQWLCRRSHRSPDQVVLMGRSLGGAVAVQLAARQGARGLVLERTFTSLPDVGERVFPWLPVRWLMRNQFESERHIAGYDGPLLQSHGRQDEIVPFDLGQRLFQRSPSREKQFVELPDCGHNDPDPLAYRQALRGFLNRLPKPAAELPQR